MTKLVSTRRAALVTALGLVSLGLTGTPALAAGLAAATGWQVSYTFPANSGDSVTAVAATAAGNAWAVGGVVQAVSGQGEGVAAAFHWNGTSWSPASLPGPVREGSFGAVSASSATNVWAISNSCGNGCGTFAASWNGKEWSWNDGVRSAYSVAALSASDVWVAAQAGLEQWNGHSWKTYAAPGPNGVSSVSGVAANDVWAAGQGAGGLQPEAVLWNGSSWKLAKLPAISLPVNGQAIPAQVVADAQNNVWMEGYIQSPEPSTQLEEYAPFVLHWNGKAWSQLKVPASVSVPGDPAGFRVHRAGGRWVGRLLGG
jgi:hypothetical protein